MKRTIHVYRFISLDFLTASASWVIFFIIRKLLLNEPINGIGIEVFINAFIVGLFWTILYMFFGAYTDILRKSRIKEFFTLMAVSALGALLIFFLLLLDDQGVSTYKAYYKTFITYFSIHYSLSILIKISLLTNIKNKIRSKKLFFNTLIIGSGEKATSIYKEINKSFEILGYKFIAYMSMGDDKGIFNQSLRYLGNIDRLTTVIKRCKIEQVIIALEKEDQHLIQSILFTLEDFKTVKISIIPEIHQHLLGSIRVNQRFDIPLIDINQELIPEWQANLKRTSDVVFSIFILVFGLPFFILIALIIKLGSKGPIVFKQERIGKDGLPFMIYKFRSMYIDAEKDGPALSREGDKRITPFGLFIRKMRIDEFPQFYNVLIGDMSLVGPRPERKFFIDQLIKIAPYYKHLNKVRPGITSLGQVKFGYAQNVEEMVERLKYEILYLENISFSMDLRILLYTVLVMIQGRGK